MFRLENLEDLIRWGRNFIIFAILFAAVIYMLYYFKLPIEIPPGNVSDAAGLFVSLAGVLLAFLAFVAYIKLETEQKQLEKEIAEKKIQEKNIEKELKRKELLGRIRNADLFSETLIKGVIPNAINLNKPNMIWDYIYNWIKEFDTVFREFIAVGGHTKDAQDLISKYNGKKITISEISPKTLLNIIKEIEEKGEDIINNYSPKETVFKSDEILRKINEIRFNLFLLEHITENSIKIEDDGEISISNTFGSLVSDTKKRLYELYLMLSYNILIE
ncbi:hypothetical protein [Persephonella sp.]|uniref:hypothetical protein n=1 Tax=Persephonella sp. TaxID=2060922 RepID=UPI00260A32E8|nr:hypothetical protein [Persephonella sp.]